MRKIFLIIFISVSIHAQNHFNKGVNLTSWFQTDNPNQIQFTKYTKQDFINIKSLGCDVIRLPINLHGMTDGTSNYNLEPLFLSFLDEVVDWAEELELNLILDNHSFDPNGSTSGNIIQILVPVWKNMAEHFKNRTNYIYYEILNEPHGISDANWNAIQQAVVNAIRQIDTTHTIIVGPPNYNSYNNLQNMPIYTDTNLIYTFHFYDPFLFTHQGASWTDPSMEPLSGMPFPFSESAMPNFPPELSNTWIQSSFNNYANDGTIEKVKELIDIAVKFKNERNVEIYCGEFGVYIPNSENSDRVLWYDTVRKYLEGNNISWTIWDYQGGFGIFEKGSSELFNYDLNVPLVKALGLNDVPQSDYIKVSETIPFNIYTDFVEHGIRSKSEGSAKLDYYFSQSQYDGKYCIAWETPRQYDLINFDFIQNKDLTNFANLDSDIYLSLMVKGDSPNSEFDIRFLDTKTDEPGDHPWRMRYTIKENEEVKWDNQWHKVEIPLAMFSEQGSWDNNQWYNPAGLFDWSDIDKFEIVTEVENLSDMNFYFDNIKFVDITTDILPEESTISYVLNQNYPNPFNPSTTIKYSIPASIPMLNSFHDSNTKNPNQYSNEYVNVKLKIYDMLGRQVATLVNEYQKAGNYQVVFDASNISSGIYYYQLQSNGFTDTKKMILMK